MKTGSAATRRGPELAVGERGQSLGQVAQRVSIERVMHPPSVSPRLDQPGLAEAPEVERSEWLTVVATPREIARALLTRRQRRDDAEPLGLAERGERGRETVECGSALHGRAWPVHAPII